jgi:DNA-binding CsgD family transcriptional regulator
LTQDALSRKSELVAEVTQQVAAAGLDPEVILNRIATSLSRRRPGTWVATLMNRDPTTSLVVVADEAEPEVATFIDLFVSSVLKQPRQAPTIGVAQDVISSGDYELQLNLSNDDLVKLTGLDLVGDFLDVNQAPPNYFVPPHGFLVVPLRAPGARIGTLGVFTRGSIQPPSEADVPWLQEIADRVGIVIENAQLRVSSAARLERLASIQAAMTAVGASRDLRRSLQAILDQLVRGLQVDAADVLVVDEQAGTLQVAASSGFISTLAPEGRFPIQQELVEWANGGQPLDSMEELDELGHFRRRHAFAREGFDGFRASPLVARGRFRGVVEVFRRSALALDEEALEFLDVLATLAAVAIDDRLRAAAAGEPALSQRRSGPSLTRLEREILQLVVEGRTNKAIGAEVHLAVDTIKFHVRKLLRKTETKNRTELAREATRGGWV